MAGVLPLASVGHFGLGFTMTAPSRPCTACNAPVPLGDMFCPACGADAPTEAPPASDAAAAPPDEPSLAELEAQLQLALGSAFEVRRLLGRGGFGDVWEAYDLRLGRSVAVKVLRPELATSSAFRKRFHREARAVAKMRHPGIVPIYHIGETQGLMYFIMPLVEGITLKTALDQEGQLSPDEATRILAEASQALREAHRRGIVHRDLKPENVMLEGPERRVLLMDFGIAQSQEPDRELTGGGLVLGSPEFMSPEQATGERRLDARSDIYSLGVVGYRMLSGKLPFVAETAREILTQHVLTPPEPLADCALVPARLSDTVMRCLAKQPDERWQSVDELLAALLGDRPLSDFQSLVTSPPLGVAAAPAAAAPAARPARRRWRFTLAVSLSAAAVGAVAWFGVGWNDLRRWEAAAIAVVTAYDDEADSLRAMAERYRQGAITGAQYRAAELSLHRAVEARVNAGYGSNLNQLAAWPSVLRDHVGAARRGTWAATLPGAALALLPSGIPGCTVERRDGVVVLRDGAPRTNCWWATLPGPTVRSYAAPVEYHLTFVATGAHPADAGLGLAWCGKDKRCWVLWAWLDGRVEWALHAPGIGLSARQLGSPLRIAAGTHALRVRFEGGGLRLWVDGRPVLARASGEDTATPRQPGDLQVVVQNTAITMPGPEALTVVGMRR